MSARVAPAALMAAAAAALATLAAYRAEPAVPVLALAGLAAAVVAATRPLLVAFAAIALIPADGVSVASLSPAEALFALAGLGWLAQCAVERRAPIHRHAVPLLLAVVPELLLADDRAAVARILVMWTLFAAVGTLVAVRGDAGTVRRVLGLLAGALAVSVVVALARGGGPVLQPGGDVATGRAVGAFSDPNVFAALLALALPGALVLRRAPSLVAAALAVAGLALTLSRGGMLAAAAGVAVLLVLPPVRRLALAGALVLAALLVFGANPVAGVAQVDTVLERVVSIGSATDSATDQRAELYRVTPAIIADHPLFGVGANRFAEVAPRYGLVDPATGFTFDHPHNLVLTIAVELGLLGLAALLWLAAALVRTLWRAGHGPERTLAVAVAAALTTVAVQGAVDYTLRSNLVAATVAVLAGCAVALSRAASGSAPRTPPP